MVALEVVVMIAFGVANDEKFGWWQLSVSVYVLFHTKQNFGWVSLDHADQWLKQYWKILYNYIPSTFKTFTENESHHDTIFFLTGESSVPQVTTKLAS